MLFVTEVFYLRTDRFETLLCYVKLNFKTILPTHFFFEILDILGRIYIYIYI